MSDNSLWAIFVVLREVIGDFLTIPPTTDPEPIPELRAACERSARLSDPLVAAVFRTCARNPETVIGQIRNDQSPPSTACKTHRLTEGLHTTD